MADSAANAPINHLSASHPTCLLRKSSDSQLTFAFSDGVIIDPVIAPPATLHHNMEGGRKGSIFADKAQQKETLAGLSQNVTGE